MRGDSSSWPLDLIGLDLNPNPRHISNFSATASALFITTIMTTEAWTPPPTTTRVEQYTPPPTNQGGIQTFGSTSTVARPPPPVTYLCAGSSLSSWMLM